MLEVARPDGFADPAERERRMADMPETISAGRILTARRAPDIPWRSSYRRLAPGRDAGGSPKDSGC